MIKIVTYNIQFGQGRDGKVDLGRIIDSVKGADLIALQEVDRFWPRSGEIDQVREIINAFESYDYAYGLGVDQAGGEIDYAGEKEKAANLGVNTLVKFEWKGKEINYAPFRTDDFYTRRMEIESYVNAFLWSQNEKRSN